MNGERFVVGASMEGNDVTRVYVIDEGTFGREVAEFEGPTAITDAARYARAKNEEWARILAEGIPF
jgi:hypothetical protein